MGRFKKKKKRDVLQQEGQNFGTSGKDPGDRRAPECGDGITGAGGFLGGFWKGQGERLGDYSFSGFGFFGKGRPGVQGEPIRREKTLGNVVLKTAVGQDWRWTASKMGLRGDKSHKKTKQL